MQVSGDVPKESETDVYEDIHGAACDHEDADGWDEDGDEDNEKGGESVVGRGHGWWLCWCFGVVVVGGLVVIEKLVPGSVEVVWSVRLRERLDRNV